jgi:hypothetical protein
MSESAYVILEGVPTAQVYHDLRKVAGLTPPPIEAVAKAIFIARGNRASLVQAR